MGLIGLRMLSLCIVLESWKMNLYCVVEMKMNKDELVFWACIMVLAILAFAGGGLTAFLIIFILFGGI